MTIATDQKERFVIMVKIVSATPATLPRSIATDITALDLLQRIYPGKIRLDAKETAAAIGITPGSIRTLRCRGTFAIKSVSEKGYCQYFDIRDVAEYLDAQRTPKPRRGAPTKAARLAKIGVAL